MNSKIFLVSFLISLLIVVNMNLNILGVGEGTGLATSASLELEGFDGDPLHFAIGNLIVFLILIGASYLLIRGVCRSFGRMFKR